MAQAMQLASGDEINRARPGLMAVALRNAHIDRKVGAARERHDAIDGNAPAPVLLGQAIAADPPAEAAAAEDNRIVGQRREVDLGGADAGIERERAAPPLGEPLIEPRRASWSQRAMPARLPVVTEVQVSAGLAEVSSIFRSGLRKFTGAKRTKRLPASVSFPCHMVSRPRPRYSAPCQVTRTRRP